MLGLVVQGMVAQSLLAQALKPPTIDQSLEMVAVTEPRISPDGLHVLYLQSRTNWEADAFETDLYVASTTGEANAHRLTAPVKSAHDAAWSPDGKWIAFLSDRPGQLPKVKDEKGNDKGGDKSQIYLMRPDGGEAVQLTNYETGVDAFEWAPDSKSLAFRADEVETKAQKDRKETFGEYHVIHADYTMQHLWLMDVPADPALTHPAPVRLTEGSFSVGDFKFSPDSTRIAFSAQRDPDLISDFSADIYTVTIAGHTVKKIVDTPGPDTSPTWSPDGTRIAFVTANGSKTFFFTNQLVAAVPAEGGKPELLDAQFDEDADLLAWAPAGIYFSAQQKTASQLFLLDPSAHSVKAVSAAGQMFAQGSISPDFKHVAFRGAAPDQVPEICASELTAFHPAVLTQAGAQFAAYPHVSREVVQWKSSDGTVIEGVLQKPADFDATRKYPLLVVIHGGPTGVDVPFRSADRYYPTERFAARGALVLHPNYRGSAGYGEKFRSLNVRNLGVGDYADVISGVDALIAKGMVDREKVGAMGWSEGGYISAFITTSSDRFKAVSVGAGISDWATYYYNTDITPFTRQYLAATPQEDPEIYRKTSPITYIAKAKTPTLIQQGSVDRRVPVANAYELRQALEDHKVPVKMVLYDGFGHPINKPKQQRAVMQENEVWFAHYIWGDVLPEALTPVAGTAAAAAK